MVPCQWSIYLAANTFTLILFGDKLISHYLLIFIIWPQTYFLIFSKHISCQLKFCLAEKQILFGSKHISFNWFYLILHTLLNSKHNYQYFWLYLAAQTFPIVIISSSYHCWNGTIWCHLLWLRIIWKLSPPSL